MKIEGVKLAIFDLDGTLIDAYQAITESMNFTLKKLGYYPIGELLIRKAVGWGDINLLKPFINRQDLKKALSIYRRHHKKSLVLYSHLFPKVKFLLAYLKRRKYKLAVASNRPTRFSHILIRHLKIEPYFDYVLCGDKLKYGKPHPEILLRIIDRLAVKRQEVVYVGDMTVDAQAGKNARVKTVIVTTGSSSPLEIKKERPDLIIKRVADLLNIL